MANIEAATRQLEGLVEAWLGEKPDHFLVDIKVLPGNKVQVFMDADDGIKIDTCAEVSRYLEKYLDEEKPLGEKYILEVSSPGMESPLKVFRQYKRRIGREVSVLKLDGQRIDGVLKAVDEKGVSIEQQKTVGKGKAKTVETKGFEISFDEIKNTKLNFTF